MKTSELIRILKDNDCMLLRHGSNHDIWKSNRTGKIFSVPRHSAEVKTGTCKSIFKSAGIK